MATGWAPEGAVQDQIDATVADAIARSRAQQDAHASQEQCIDCDAVIPERRQHVIRGVQRCVACQEIVDSEAGTVSGYNRRGSKDSQLR